MTIGLSWVPVKPHDPYASLALLNSTSTLLTKLPIPKTFFTKASNIPSNMPSWCYRSTISLHSKEISWATMVCKLKELPSPGSVSSLASHPCLCLSYHLFSCYFPMSLFYRLIQVHNGCLTSHGSAMEKSTVGLEHVLLGLGDFT